MCDTIIPPYKTRSKETTINWQNMLYYREIQENPLLQKLEHFNIDDNDEKSEWIFNVEQVWSTKLVNRVKHHKSK